MPRIKSDTPNKETFAATIVIIPKVKVMSPSPMSEAEKMIIHI